MSAASDSHMTDDVLLSLCLDPAARAVMVDNLKVRKEIAESNRVSIVRMKCNLGNAEHSLRLQVAEIARLEKALTDTADGRLF